MRMRFPEKAAKRRDSLRSEQVAYLIKTQPGSIVSNVIIAMLVALVASADMDRLPLVLWILLVLALNLARLAFHYVLKRHQLLVDQPQRALTVLTSLTALAGACWALLLLGYPDITTGQAPWVIVIVAGVSAGAVLLGAVIAAVGIAFVTPLLVTLALRLLAQGSTETTVIAVSIFVYMLFLFRTARRSEEMFAKQIGLKHQVEEREREAKALQGVLESTRLQERLAVEIAEIGIAMYDVASDTAQLNDRLYEILQVDRDWPTTGEAFMRLAVPEDRRLIKESILAFRNGNDGLSAKQSIRIRRPSGELRYLQVLLTDYSDDELGSHKRLAIFRDVTDETLFSRQLEKQLVLSRTSAEIAGLGIFEYDQQSDRFHFDQQLCTIYGVGSDGYPRSHAEWLQWVHPNDRERIEAGVPKLHSGAETANDWQYSIIRLDGEVRHLRVKGAVINVPGEDRIIRTGAVLDETDEVIRNHALLEDRRQLSNALSTSQLAIDTAGLGEFSHKSGEFSANWSSRLRKIFGVSPEHPTDRDSFYRLVHPDDVEEFRQAMHLFYETAAAFKTESFNFRMIRPSDGELRHLKLALTTSVLPRGEGEAEHYLFSGVVADITDEVLHAQLLEDERRKLEKALTISRIAVNSAGLGEFTANEVRQISEWSPRLREIFGVDSAFVPTMESLLALIHPEDREFVRKQIALGNPDVVNKAPYVNEYQHRIIRPDGEIRHIKVVSNHTIVDENGDSITVGLVEDITDAVKLTHRLEADKKKLSKALAQSEMAAGLSRLGVYEYDRKNDRFSVDSQIRTIYGLSDDDTEFTRKDAMDQVHPDDTAYVLEQFQNVGRGGAHQEMHYRIIRPTGEVRHIKTTFVNDTIHGGDGDTILGGTLDVTEQMLAQKQLEQDRRLLSATLTSISDGILRVDPDGVVQYHNDAALGMASLNDEEIIGRRFDDVYALFDGNGDALEIGTLTESLGENGHLACEISSRGGKRNLEVSVSPMSRASGEADGFVIVFHDVTELKVSQAALASSEELFRLALNNAPVGIVVIESDGRYSFVNEAFASILGVKVEELLGHQVGDRLGGIDVNGTRIKDAQELRKQSEADGNYTEFQSTFDRADGQEIRVFTRVRRVRDLKGEIKYSVAQVQDVTAETLRLEELHEAKELAQVTVLSASEGIARTDANGNITLCNPVAAQLVGISMDEIVGRSFEKLFRFKGQVGSELVANPVTTVLETGEHVRLNSTVRLATVAGGGEIPVYISVAPTLGTEGQVNGSVILIQDASEITKLTDRLTTQAFTDDLTGLANRRAFEQHFSQRPAGEDDDHKQDFLLMVDLDHFKIVNDVCGHAIGDQLLKDLAVLLRSHTNSNDFVARLGGDEFALVLVDTNKDEALAKADEIVNAVDEYYLIHEGRKFKVGASIGLSEIQPSSGVSQLLFQADSACLAAKSLGRGRSHLFKEADASAISIKQSLNWYQRIQDGLEKQHFRPFLQEIVGSEREIVGYEMLVRYEDENGKIYSPAAFMDEVRRHDMLTTLDKSMISKALEMLGSSAFNTAVSKDHYLSVNLSAASAADPDFQLWLLNEVESNSAPVKRMWIELTESDRLRWSDELLAFLTSLHLAGVRFFLDDFGTGYNSFDLLKKLPVDGLKIDYGVTHNVMSSPVDQALVDASSKIAQALGLDIVAEGIENDDVFRYLRDLGIKKFQGYHFHKPEDARAILSQEIAVTDTRQRESA